MPPRSGRQPADSEALLIRAQRRALHPRLRADSRADQSSRRSGRACGVGGSLPMRRPDVERSLCRRGRCVVVVFGQKFMERRYIVSWSKAAWASIFGEDEDEGDSDDELVVAAAA